MFTPFNQRFSLATKGESYTVSPVSALEFPWNPDTVIWIVVAVGILTFNTVLFAGCRSHVFKEVFERAPAFANGNASPSIVLEDTAFRIQAPLPDTLPHAMLKGSRLAVSGTAGVAAKFHAAAAFRIPGQQISGAHDRRLSATAATQPHPLFISDALKSHGGEHSKLPSRQIN